jgi:hypothetical protein
VYTFNSPVADRLQACYGKLSDLGYEVVDLALWRKAPEAKISPDGPVLAKTVGRGRSANAGPPKAELPFVAKLGASNPEDPSNLPVVELGGDQTSHSIRTAEAMAKALYAAADPSRPEPERLTYLRCAKIGGSDRIMEVGFGNQADGGSGPAEWKPVSDWYDAARKAPEPPPPELAHQTTEIQPNLPL